MKKIMNIFVIFMLAMILLLFIFLIWHFNFNVPAIVINDSEEIIKEYNNMLVGDSVFEAKQYLDSSISKVPVESADEMVLKLINFQEENINNKIEKFANIVNITGMMPTLDSISNPEIIENADLKNITIELLNSGYNFKNVEGNLEIVVDYELYNSYDNYISDELKSYIKLLSKKSNYYDSEYGFALSSVKDLLDYALEIEEHYTKYKSSNTAIYTRQLFNEVITTSIKGWNGMNLNVYNNWVNNQSYYAYEDFLISNEEGVAYEIIKEYMEILQECRRIIVIDEVQNFYNNLESNIYKLLDEI